MILSTPQAVTLVAATLLILGWVADTIREMFGG